MQRLRTTKSDPAAGEPAGRQAQLVALAVTAWLVSRQSSRFLAVLVIANPCPLLIAIPITIIGAISVAARRGIIVKNPGAMEGVGQCRTAIFDKTGTLTYGTPVLAKLTNVSNLTTPEVLALAASLERYSRHPLASAVTNAAAKQGQR